MGLAAVEVEQHIPETLEADEATQHKLELVDKIPGMAAIDTFGRSKFGLARASVVGTAALEGLP